MKHPHYSQCVTASFLLMGISLLVAARADTFLAQLSQYDSMPAEQSYSETDMTTDLYRITPEDQGAVTTEGTWDVQTAAPEFAPSTDVYMDPATGMPAPTPEAVAKDMTTEKLLLLGMIFMLVGFLVHLSTILWHRYKEHRKTATNRMIASMGISRMKI